jgi:DNA integrity scanning protein DisA with diadenylate cyclase activity
MMIRASSAGSLLITRGNSQIGRFINGKFIRATPDPFYSKAMGSYILATIRDHDGFKKYENTYWHVYRETLDVLLDEASARGHGGTVIVIPDGHTDELAEFFSATYSFTSEFNLASAMTRLISESSSELIRLALNKSYLERIEALAQLSSVDGALVFSSRLEVISFGSILRAPIWRGRVAVGADGFGGGGEEFDYSKLGTRHKSAINFIGTCTGSYGFVISEDGPVRGLVKKDEDTILCWPDCNISMFVK